MAALYWKRSPRSGLLRALGGQHVEHVGVERPGAEPLRDGHAEQAVPRAAARLELRLEALARVGHVVGLAGRRLDAEQQGRLEAGRSIVEEAILAEQRQVADAARIAEILDLRHAAVHMAFADVGALQVRQAGADRQVLGDAICVAQRRRQDRIETMRMVRAGRGQLRVAERVHPDDLEEDRRRALALFEGGGRDGVDGTGAARRGHAGGMVRVGRRTEQQSQRCRAGEGLAIHGNSPHS